MSDLKVDGVIASTGTNTNLTLEGKGTGGVKITDYLIQTKGADIGSATSLTLGKDGNQFDVTGTTTITSIATQGIGSYVTLHFDGALTFTHHSTNLILPGGASITTAAGDIAVMYEYASADWRCVSYTKASGAAVVAAGGGTVLISTVTATNASSADFDGALSSTYDQYLMVGSNIHMDTDATFIWVRCDVNGGASYDSGGTDYAWNTYTKYLAERIIASDLSDSEISLTGDSATYDFSNESTHTESFHLWINGPSNTTFLKTMQWNVSGFNTTTSPSIQVGFGNGAYLNTAAYDSIQILPSSGNFDGVFRLYGLANS
jgi:hypothetical protein